MLVGFAVKLVMVGAPDVGVTFTVAVAVVFPLALLAVNV
jgi:hypothetical protein